jgi:hypothetical protein
VKHPLDNKTVDWCEKATPKFIETELGREKFCKHCQEYWPADSDFWYMVKDTLKDGTVVHRPDSACKGCYVAVYKAGRSKRKNNKKSFHERGKAA